MLTPIYLDEEKLPHKLPIAIAIIFAVGVVVYYGVSSCQFLPLWDDACQVLNNPDIRSLRWQNIGKIFTSYYAGMYQPLSTLTYAIDYQVWGMSSKGFHITNLALHLTSAVMVLLIFYKLTHKIGLSLFFALVFVVHPVQVEAVAWVSARSTLLSTIFFLLAFYVYLKYLRSGQQIKFLLFTFGLFVLSVLSKCTAVTLPIVLMLLDYQYERKNIFRIVLEKFPFIIVSIIIGLTAIDARVADGQISDMVIENSDSKMIIVVLNSIVIYLSKVIFPVNYSAYYTFPPGDLQSTYYILPISVFLSILFIILFQLKAKRKKMVFGLMFFLITLSISLKLVPVGLHLMADRYLYLPLIGLFFVVIECLEWMKRYRPMKFIVYGIAIIFFGYYIVTSINYLHYWKNEDSLFAQTIKVNPDAITVKNMLGIRYKCKGDLKAAKKIFDEIIADYPEYGSTYNNRGNLWRSVNQPEMALRDYRMGLQYTKKAVDSSSVITNIGIVFSMKNEINMAVRFFNMAIFINPQNKQAYYNRGNARAIAGDFQGACEDFDKAIEIDKEFDQACNARTLALSHLAKH